MILLGVLTLLCVVRTCFIIFGILCWIIFHSILKCCRAKCKVISLVLCCMSTLSWMTPSPNHIVGVQCVSRIPEHMDRTSNIPSSNMHTSGSTTQNGISDIPVGNSGLNLLCESDRLKTFENWPVSFMNVNDLAAAGFYYLNKGDLVRCPYCSIEVGKWVEGDDPVADHRRHSPHCRYVSQLRSGPGNSLVHVSNGYDVCGAFSHEMNEQATMNTESKISDAALQKFGIHTNRPPTFPIYTTYEARLKSFDAWPISMKLKPAALSDAGFFYTGKGDQTICFHCGGGLKDWEDTDDAWVEHARHFSTCNYVLLIKGNEFVEEACGKKVEVATLTREEMNAIIEKHGVIPVPPTDESVVDERNLNKQESCSTQTNNDTNTMKNDNNDNTLCRVCFTEERSAVFLPCGHLVVCGKCAVGLKTCVICRKPCEARVRIFMS